MKTPGRSSERLELDALIRANLALPVNAKHPVWRMLPKDRRDYWRGRQAGQALVAVVLSKAMEGDLESVKWLADRGYGRPRQAVDVTSGGDRVAVTIYDTTQAARFNGHDRPAANGTNGRLTGSTA